MKYLVFSDTHHCSFACEQALQKHPDAVGILHLGDVEADVTDLQFLTTLPIVAVTGNNEYGFCQFPLWDCLEIAGHRIFLTHGHVYEVRRGVNKVVSAALQHGCDICLFGHTHQPLWTIEKGIYVGNPGAGKDGRYGVLTIGDRVEFQIEKD